MGRRGASGRAAGGKGRRGGGGRGQVSGGEEKARAILGAGEDQGRLEAVVTAKSMGVTVPTMFSGACAS